MEEDLEFDIKENPYLFPYFNIPLTKRDQYLFMNIKTSEEEKNDGNISFSFGEKKKSEGNNLNTNNEDSFFKSIEGTTQNDNSSNNNIERKETPQFKKNISEKKEILDEINLRLNYDKIEKELNKFNHKNINGIEINENDINKRIDKYNKISPNSQMKDEELLNCSDNEDTLNKKIISNNEKIRMLQNQIKKLGQNNIMNYNMNRNSMGNNNNIYKDNNKNFIYNEINEKNKMYQKLFEKVEYGIDENGNPISLKEYKEEFSKKKNNTKIIAYIIISKEKGKNYLIDLKGNIIPKMEDGDFNCKYGNIVINIKNFDVQNPKLRVFGCRQKFASIFSEEESESQNSVRPNLLSEIKSRFLLSKLKDNIIVKNNRNSVFLNRLNKNEKSLHNKRKGNKQQFKSGTNQYIQKTEKKRIYHYHYNKNKNKKEDTNHKISKNKNYKDIFNMSHKNNDLFRKTNALLSSKIRHSHNNFNFNCLNNTFINKQEHRYSTRKNRTPSPTQQEFTSTSKRIKNKENTQKKESNCKNDNNFINLNIININNKDNPLMNKNKRIILKNSSSSTALINNHFNKKIHPILRKSQSTSNNITITLNSISNNIKKIENNIHNTIKKIIDKNISISYKYRNQIKNDLSDTSNYSKRGSLNEYSYFFNKNKNKFFENKFEFDEHKNEINKINFRRILLNKKCKISTSPKNFKCSILSKDANEIITDYTNRSVSKKNVTKSSTRKINEFRKNNENKKEYKIKSYLDRNENNMMFKFNRSNNYINNSYNSNKYENKYCHIRNDNLMKKKSQTNINNFTFSFQRNTFLNKSNKKENLLLTNKENNKKIINKNGISFNDFSRQKIKSNSEYSIFNVKNKIVKSRISPNIRNKMLFYHK